MQDAAPRSTIVTMPLTGTFPGSAEAGGTMTPQSRRMERIKGIIFVTKFARTDNTSTNAKLDIDPSFTTNPSARHGNDER
jgi:hypothetical protein